VLVTGGSSLIGAGVAAALVARGDEVVVQQRSRSDAVSVLDVRQELGDIRDLDAVRSAAAGCEWQCMAVRISASRPDWTSRCASTSCKAQSNSTGPPCC
jgi:nucleoside-diphosphate-sugar epimerase